MSEKRFELDWSKKVGTHFVLDTHTDERIDFYSDVVDLLNELHEENERLRHDATILIQSNQDYRKENEQLKQQLIDCEKFRHAVFQEISKEMNKHD